MSKEIPMNRLNQHNSRGVSRRDILKTVAGTAAVGALAAGGRMAAAQQAESPPKSKGRIKQAACQGVFGKTTFEEKCQICVDLGLHGIDLVRPDDWPTLKKHGLICTMVPSHSLSKGINHKENHDECLAAIRASIEGASEAGFPNVIVLSGNRNGISDEEGIANCILALKQVAGLAEKKNVTLSMELLNSKVNHKDYHCDRTWWGAEVVKGVGSPRVKLLYDIYHMQVQEGDIIATIREHFEHIAHFHTAGVPGRNEIDESQELYYPAIMQAIADLGYTGYVSHEYRPKKDPLECLKKAIAWCDV
jgi:hydroxypyruvate isomerase